MVGTLRHEAFQHSHADIRIKALIAMEKYSVALFLTLTLLVCNFTSASQSSYCTYGITVKDLLKLAGIHGADLLSYVAKLRAHNIDENVLASLTLQQLNDIGIIAWETVSRFTISSQKTSTIAHVQAAKTTVFVEMVFVASRAFAILAKDTMVPVVSTNALVSTVVFVRQRELASSASALQVTQTTCVKLLI